jgi:exodeoxyribonuclease VII small subunit
MTKGKGEGKFDFGEAYRELEGIVSWFEREEVDLEEGIRKFERGLELAERCKKRLKDVENRVTAIKSKFDGLADGEVVE